YGRPAAGRMADWRRELSVRERPPAPFRPRRGGPGRACRRALAFGEDRSVSQPGGRPGLSPPRGRPRSPGARGVDASTLRGEPLARTGTRMSAMEPTGRINSMDQFRGYTVAGMFVVNFVGDLAAIPAVLKHNDTWFSYADSIMPSFLFAAGFT